MIHSTKAARFHYLDHARGFIILLVVLQHAINPYGLRLGWKSSFALDVDRSIAFDAIYMLTDGFIMQALFFISGMFLLPSLQRRGWLSFSWEKIVRLVIPFFFAVIFVVPLEAYAKYLLLDNVDQGFLHYWVNVYAFNFSNASVDPTLSGVAYWFEYLSQGFAANHLQSGGFWFIGVLAVFSFVAAFLHTIFPFVVRALGGLVSWMVRRPILGYLLFAGLSALMISVGDIMWGTTYSITLGTSLLWVRGNMFWTFIFYFALGVGVRHAAVLTNEDVLQKMNDHWQKWVLLTIVLSVLYMGYIVIYMYDGAFTNELAIHFYYKGRWNIETWISAWPLLEDLAPGILVRTILHGFLCAAQTITVIVVLYRFTNSDIPFWTSLAAFSYGIYYLHEPIVVWAQYFLVGSGLPALIKATVAFIIGMGLSWVLTDKVLRKLPLTRRVF